jgi:hypothetical protein
VLRDQPRGSLQDRLSALDSRKIETLAAEYHLLRNSRGEAIWRMYVGLSPVAICRYTCAQAGVLHAQCLDVRHNPRSAPGLAPDDLIPELLGGGDD